MSPAPYSPHKAPRWLFPNTGIDLEAEGEAALNSPFWGFYSAGLFGVFVPPGIDQAEIRMLAVDMQEDAYAIPYGKHRMRHDRAAIQYHLQSGQSAYSYTGPIMDYWQLSTVDFRPPLTKEDRKHFHEIYQRSNPGKQ